MSKEEIISNFENLFGRYSYFKAQKPKFVESKDMPMLATNNIISSIMYNHLINNNSIAKLSNHFKMNYSVVSRVVCESKRKYRVEYQRRKILTKGSQKLMRTMLMPLSLIWIVIDFKNNNWINMNLLNMEDNFFYWPMGWVTLGLWEGRALHRQPSHLLKKLQLLSIFLYSEKECPLKKSTNKCSTFKTRTRHI